MQLIKQLMCTAFILLGLGAIAQQKPSAFSLKQAQDYAIEFNKSLKNAELDVLASQKKVWENIASGLPQIDAQADYSNFMGAEMVFGFDPSMPATKVPFKPTSNLNITVSQLVFSGSYIVGLQAAKIYQQLSEKSLVKSQTEIREQVTNTYSLILVNELTLDILKKNLVNLKDTYVKTKSMLEVGMVESTDVDQLEVAVTTLENNILSTGRQVEVAYNMLRLLLGLTIDSPVTLTDNLTALMEQINFVTLAGDSLVLANNPDYQLIEKQTELVEKQLTLSKMSYVPTIAAYYQNTTKMLKPDVDFSPKNVVGLNMTIPIFSSGVRKSKVDQARIALDQSLNNKIQMEDNLRIQEYQLRYNLRSAHEKYLSQKKNVEVAGRVNQKVDLKFRQGTVSSLDLTQANDSYLAAQGNYIGATMELIQAYSAWLKLLNNEQ